MEDDNGFVSIYPCHDAPTSCGWGKDKTYNPEITGICKYPDCWCSQWLVFPAVQNKTSKVGEKIEAIVYRGESNQIAKNVYEYLNLLKTNHTLLGLANAVFRIHIVGLTVVESNGYKQVELRGRLV